MSNRFPCNSVTDWKYVPQKVNQRRSRALITAPSQQRSNTRRWRFVAFCKYTLPVPSVHCIWPSMIQLCKSFSVYIRCQHDNIRLSVCLSAVIFRLNSNYNNSSPRQSLNILRLWIICPTIHQQRKAKQLVKKTSIQVPVERGIRSVLRPVSRYSSNAIDEEKRTNCGTNQQDLLYARKTMTIALYKKAIHIAANTNEWPAQLHCHYLGPLGRKTFDAELHRAFDAVRRLVRRTARSVIIPFHCSSRSGEQKTASIDVLYAWRQSGFNDTV